MESSAKKKIDYLDKDLAKVQKVKTIGGDAYEGHIDDSDAYQRHQMKQLDALRQETEDLNNQHR